MIWGAWSFQFPAINVCQFYRNNSNGGGNNNDHGANGGNNNDHGGNGGNGGQGGIVVGGNSRTENSQPSQVQTQNQYNPTPRNSS
jgi:hypothetical protein